jgi:hypothetical protein
MVRQAVRVCVSVCVSGCVCMCKLKCVSVSGFVRVKSVCQSVNTWFGRRQGYPNQLAL